MLKTDFRLADLIAKYLAGDIEPLEQEALDHWKNESEQNLALFNRLTDPANIRQLQQMAAHYDAAGGWNHFVQLKKAQKRRFFLLRAGYAAVFLIFISAGLIYFVVKRETPQDSVTQPVISELIVPGGTRATLTLADGSAVDLDQHSDYKLEEKKEQVRKSAPGKKEEPAPVYHKIETPKGGEYAFSLSDGTFVRLNAMSAIYFPVDFADGDRVVELEGQAFFDVKNTGRPFRIKTKDILVEVMGTSFNISSYPDEAGSRTTLISGAVKVQAGQEGKSVVLSPSQQASFDRATGDIEVKTVDVSSFIAWNNGMFYFKDLPLEEIMKDLSRWYDIDEVVYKDERLKSMVFGCKFSKYEDISQVLDLFERTGKVHMRVQGKTIIINH